MSLLPSVAGPPGPATGASGGLVPGPGSAAVQFGWGPVAAAELAGAAAALVVVDTLSFSTAVTVAVGRGMVVHPLPPGGSLDVPGAAWAVRRGEVDGAHPWSLSPAHLLAAPAVERLVLPSPNGSTIAATVNAGTVVAGCLRNASAVAAWLADRGFGHPDRPVVVVAAGERWPDGSLRPAVEDLLGAGAIIAALPARLLRSAEAVAAEAAWQALAPRVEVVLAGCTSGEELVAAGYGADVALAGEVDVDRTVPVLVDGAFRRVGGGR